MAEPAWIIEAAKHIGFKEGPDNKNRFGTHYRIPNQPWCALFVSWCCQKVDQPLPSMQSGMPDGYAGVYLGMEWAKANGFFRPSWEADPGDAVVYGWAGPHSAPDNMHTGLIVSGGAKGETAHTVEGNRADQVERQTFVVGQATVLGTIAITKILASKQMIKSRPAPQPRNARHPHNSGPVPTDLNVVTDADLVVITEKLDKRTHAVAARGGERKRLRAAEEAIERVLALKG